MKTMDKEPLIIWNPDKAIASLRHSRAERKLLGPKKKLKPEDLERYEETMRVTRRAALGLIIEYLGLAGAAFLADVFFVHAKNKKREQYIERELADLNQRLADERKADTTLAEMHDSMEAQPYYLGWKKILENWSGKLDEHPYAKSLTDYFIENARSNQKGLERAPHGFLIGPLSPEANPEDTPRKAWFRKYQIPFWGNSSQTLYLPPPLDRATRVQLSKLTLHWPLILYPLHTVYSLKTKERADENIYALLQDDRKTYLEPFLPLLEAQLQNLPDNESDEDRLQRVLQALSDVANILVSWTLGNLKGREPDVYPSPDDFRVAKARLLLHFAYFLRLYSDTALSHLKPYFTKILQEPELITDTYLTFTFHDPTIDPPNTEPQIP